MPPIGNKPVRNLFADQNEAFFQYPQWVIKEAIPKAIRRSSESCSGWIEISLDARILLSDAKLMYEAVARLIILPAHERLRGRRTIAFYRLLCRLESQPTEILTEFRLKRLRQLIHHCVDHVPFYRERIRAAGIVEPERIDFDQLASLPPLERAEVRQYRETMVADNYRGRLIRYNTGGSTGEPLVFYTDREKEAWHNAHKLRARARFGVLPGDREVDLWGSPIELERLTGFRVLKDRWLLNHRVLTAFDLTDSRLQDYARTLASWRPRLLYGYPTAIYRLARRILEEPALLDGWRPRLVSCTSEMLYDHQREVIATAFRCPVANEYGARDAGLIGHECPEGRMHLAEEHVHVELDRPDEDGVGDLLVTNLDGFGMPLIRYRVGDRGALDDKPCPCGIPSRTVRRLVGRANDFLVGRAGKLVHSLAPIYVLRDISKLRQFRVEQREDCSLLVQLLVDGNMSHQELDEIRAKMQGVLDMEVPVSFEFPEVISPETSGKYRWVVSRATAS